MEETDRNAQSCFSQDVETEEARLPQLKAAARRGRKRGELFGYAPRVFGGLTPDLLAAVWDSQLAILGSCRFLSFF